jgi:hypothetical protein
MNTADIIINVIIHSFILFVFLSLFFFLYISKIEKDELSNQTEEICKRVPMILDTLKKEDKNNIIDWKSVRQKAIEELNYDDIDITDYIGNNNQGLKYTTIIIGSSMFFLAFTIYIYYAYFLKQDIDISYIIKENIAIFISIGIIEFLFFTKVSSKYVPILPSQISTTLLNRIKENIMTTN